MELWGGVVRSSMEACSKWEEHMGIGTEDLPLNTTQCAVHGKWYSGSFSLRVRQGVVLQKDTLGKPGSHLTLSMPDLLPPGLQIS